MMPVWVAEVRWESGPPKAQGFSDNVRHSEVSRYLRWAELSSGSRWTNCLYSVTRKKSLFSEVWKQALLITWGLTRKEELSLELTQDLNCKVVFTGKSVRTFNRAMNKSCLRRQQFSDFSPPRKGSQGELFLFVPQTDTGGLVQVYQGDREKNVQGTRQKS